ncbi:MAG: hypothetical protein AB7P03_23305 [Kofleriaceae bacterium]
MQRKSGGHGRFVPGISSPGVRTAILVGVQTVISPAWADRTAVTIPDPPPRSAPPSVPPSGFGPSWDLDGVYLWLGPIGAAAHVDQNWDSTIGGQLAITRVRERERLGLIGVAAGASAWTEQQAGRVWLDLVAGNRFAGRMAGLSIGPVLELNALAHPRIGGALGCWAFVGVTPYARVGWVHELGMLGEIGVYIAFPVYRAKRSGSSNH